MSPTISRRTLKNIIEYAESGGANGTYALVNALKELRAALKPKRAVIAARKPRAEKKRTKAQKTRDVRAAVTARADGRCECCGIEAYALELDHFAGRGRRETVESCWALISHHHFQKTNGVPSRIEWLRRFADHCVRHNYSSERIRALNEIRAEEMIAEASALTRGEARGG